MAYKIKSKSEYKRLREKTNEHSKAFEKYRTATKRNWIDKEAERKYNIPKDVSNSKKSAIEIYEYKNKPIKKNEKYTAYLNGDGTKITTWTGDKIADVNYLKENKGYRTGMWEQHYSFEGTDINGKRIKGRAYAGKGGYVRFNIKE
jgi:hypothetical protein